MHCIVGEVTSWDGGWACVNLEQVSDCRIRCGSPFCLRHLIQADTCSSALGAHAHFLLYLLM